MIIDAVDRVSQGDGLQHLDVLVLLRVLEQHHVHRDRDRRLVNAGVILFLAFLRQCRVQLLLGLANNHSILCVVFLGVLCHFHIVKSHGYALDDRVRINQRAVHMAIVRHGVAVVCFRVDPSHNVSDVRLFGDPILRDVLSVSDFYPVISSGPLVDNDSKVIKKNLSAPP